jgi:hypothetical protein
MQCQRRETLMVFIVQVHGRATQPRCSLRPGERQRASTTLGPLSVRPLARCFQPLQDFLF